jgi:hypothetical protein
MTRDWFCGRGLVPVVALAQRVGLGQLAGEHVRIGHRCEVNPDVKAARNRPAPGCAAVVVAAITTTKIKSFSFTVDLPQWAALEEHSQIPAFQVTVPPKEFLTGRLGTQERPPGRIRIPRGRTATPGAQDPPHGRFADLTAAHRVTSSVQLRRPARRVTGRLTVSHVGAIARCVMMRRPSLSTAINSIFSRMPASLP